MDDSADQASRPAGGTPPRTPSAPTRAGSLRLPSRRFGALLAAAMLGLGVAVGAALGPAPEASLAGGNGVAQRLPALIAAAEARGRAEAAAAPAAPVSTTTTSTPPAIVPQAKPAAASTPAVTTSTPAEAVTPSTESRKTSPTPKKTAAAGTSELPPITSVWLIQLAGVSFTEALANATAAPYIDGQLLPKATFLSSWSALSASAFAGDAALAEKQATVAAAPPILHSIVQPPCPEGAAGATCAAGTPGALSAADQFLSATLATITATTTYAEHGLVVVTFASVADPAGTELAPGSSSATLTSEPPAGVALLSPFAKAGAKPTIAFDPISPKQSLEKLLHANA